MVPDLDALVREARCMVEAEEYRKAVAVYEQILHVDPNHREALLVLGSIYLEELSDVRRARELLQRAVDLYQDDGRGYYNLGTCEAKVGNHKRAIELFEGAIDRNFDVVRSHYNCGNSYASLADAASMKGNDSAAKLLVLKAAEHYAAALETAPQFPPALVNLGSCFLRLGSHAEALKCYNKALTVMPSDLVAWTGKLLVYVNKGDYERTLRTLNEMWRWSSGWFSVQSHLQRCESYIRDLVGAQKKRDDERVIRDLRGPLVDCASSLEKLARVLHGERKQSADVESASQKPGIGTARPWTPDTRPLVGEDRRRLLVIKRKLDRNSEVIGDSAVLLRVFERIHQLNQADDTKPIVILGETGVGKTYLVPLIVASSPRTGGRYEVVAGQRFAGHDFNIAKGELLGYAKGHGLQGVPLEGKDGLLQHCDDGTLFIDELLWLPREMQALLLTILDGAKVQKVGDLAAGYQPKTRFIFATNRDPLEEVAKGNLLHDLWRRISPYCITIPPLRERKEDIALLVRSILGKRRVESRVLLSLLLYDWPGNVGELVSVLGKIPKKKTSRETPDKVGLSSLELPAWITSKVCEMTAAEAELGLAHLLVCQLKTRGFELGKGLNTELARLLGISESKASSLLKHARA